MHWIESWPRGSFKLWKEPADYYISYVPNGLGSDCCETALVRKADESGEECTYYILDGDHRRDYEALYDAGWDACFAFYQAMKDDFQSVWSADKKIESVVDLGECILAIDRMITDMNRGE